MLGLPITSTAFPASGAAQSSCSDDPQAPPHPPARTTQPSRSSVARSPASLAAMDSHRSCLGRRIAAATAPLRNPLKRRHGGISRLCVTTCRFPSTPAPNLLGLVRRRIPAVHLRRIPRLQPTVARELLRNPLPAATKVAAIYNLRPSAIFLEKLLTPVRGSSPSRSPHHG